MKPWKTFNYIIMASLFLIIIGGCELEDSTTAPLPPEAGNPIIRLSENSLDFSAQYDELELEIENAGSGTLRWSISYNRNWIEVTPTRGTTSHETDVVTVTVHREDLEDGTYTGSLTVSSDTGESKTVEIRMTKMPPRVHIEPSTLDFGSNLDRLQFTIINVGGGVLNWIIDTDNDWITTSTASGYTSRESDPITVWVNRDDLGRGRHEGTVTVMSEAGDAVIRVIMDNGHLIWSYSPEDDYIFDDLWECYDNNIFSDLDYWGVVTLNDGEDEFNAIWCNGVGNHPDNRYDNNMDSHMRLRDDEAINIRNFTDVSVCFKMAYETEEEFDYVRFLLQGTDGTWYYIEDVTEWDGMDYTWRDYEISLDLFNVAPQNSLRFGFFFNSDINNGYRGALIRDIEVWGN